MDSPGDEVGRLEAQGNMGNCFLPSLGTLRPSEKLSDCPHYGRFQEKNKIRVPLCSIGAFHWTKNTENFGTEVNGTGVPEESFRISEKC